MELRPAAVRPRCSTPCTHIRYRTPTGEPYLYAIAFYDHHEQRWLADGLATMEGLEPEPAARFEDAPPGAGEPRSRSWVRREGGAVVARLTLTPTQLMVECESRERLNELKHRLAGTFGYSLHFRGETEGPPARKLSVEDVMKEEVASVVVTADEDRMFLASFLDRVYLEWADQESPALGGQTPRRAAASPAARDKVGALIDEMERNDIGRRRTGRPAFEYNRLRAHVGLEEVVR
ncbi:MAG: hypothetical protein KatS3mg082_0602 [Nitrospiraceae bacterium]|nr:MAG: hypothetical protein KatS3mg082_0602 [Nitrospiraceae bacterium]